MKKILILLVALWTTAGGAMAAMGADDSDFDRNFCDSTLRLNYFLGGMAGNVNANLHTMQKWAGWAGRRHHLREAPRRGNGSVTVTDAATGDTIYLTTFSTLFQEWLATDEAATESRGFENTFLVPLPRHEARITIELLDTRNRPVATSTNIYCPADILIETLRSAGHPSLTIHRGGSSEQAIDVAILAEGYTPEQTDSFYAHARRAVDAILEHEPFKSRAADFNFYAVASPSADSDVSQPLTGTWRNTAFGSHFSTFYSDRYLTTPNVGRIHDALAATPYEHIIILANTPTYGGGGIYNSYTLTSALDEWFEPVVVHEFGHSFGGLADEYFYDDEDTMDGQYSHDIEPWEPNITTLTNFTGKWESLIPPTTPLPTPADRATEFEVGLFEGAGYHSKGIYRPADECRMRNNTWPTFCPGCRLALTRLIDFYTRP